MTIEYFPFDAGSGANITEGQWRRMAKHWRTSGVLPDYVDHPLGFFTSAGVSAEGNDLENELKVTGSSSSLAVQVQPGEAWIRGHYFRSDAVETLPITPNTDPNGYQRIDRVVLRLDTVANIIYLNVRQGTPAASPTPPSLNLNETGLYEIPLAKVTVPTTATVGTQLTIEDERVPSCDTGLTFGAVLYCQEGVDSAQSLPNGGYTNVDFTRSAWALEGMADTTNNTIWIPMNGTYLITFVYRTTGASGIIGAICATQKGQPLNVSNSTILGRAEVKEGTVSVISYLKRDQVVWASIYNGSGAAQSSTLYNISVPSLTVVRLGDAIG